MEGSPWIREQGELQAVVTELEKILVIAEHASEGLEDLYRNLGIAYGRLKCPQPNLYPKVRGSRIVSGPWLTLA